MCIQSATATPPQCVHTLGLLALATCWQHAGLQQNGQEQLATDHDECILVRDEGFLTLGVGCLIGLRQAAPGGLSHLCLVKGFGKTYHRHVLPFALAPVVLLQQARSWSHYFSWPARLDTAQNPSDLTHFTHT